MIGIIGLVPSLVLFSIVPSTTAWGSLGHRTIAYLAQKHLTNDGAALVNNLLGSEDISDAALWPDEIRHTHGWAYTAGWHFIGTFVARPSFLVSTFWVSIFFATRGFWWWEVGTTYGFRVLTSCLPGGIL